MKVIGRVGLIIFIWGTVGFSSSNNVVVVIACLVGALVGAAAWIFWGGE